MCMRTGILTQPPVGLHLGDPHCHSFAEVADEQGTQQPAGCVGRITIEELAASCPLTRRVPVGGHSSADSPMGGGGGPVPESRACAPRIAASTRCSSVSPSWPPNSSTSS